MNQRFIRQLFVSLIFCLVATISNGQVAKKAKIVTNMNRIIISGCFETKEIPQKVELLLWDDIVSEDHKFQLPHKEVKSIVENGKFVLTIDSVSTISYLSFGWQHQRGYLIEFLYLYLAEPGDSIFIRITDTPSVASPKVNTNSVTDDEGNVVCTHQCYIPEFLGKGSLRYKCKYELNGRFDELAKEWARKRESPYSQNFTVSKVMAELRYNLDAANFCLQGQLKMLNQYKAKLNSTAYNILKTDVICDALCHSFYTLSGNLKILTQDTSINWFNIKWDTERKEIDNHLKASDRLISLMSMNTLFKSENYTKYLLMKLMVEQYLKKNRTVHDLAKDKYRGVLREKLMLSNILAFGWKWDPIIRSKAENDAYRLTKTKYYKGLLKDIMDTRTKNSIVYNFSLPDTSGKMVCFGDYRSKIIFIDFYFYGCGGCAQYYKNVVSKVKEKFKNNSQVVFVAISIDKDREKWMKGIYSGKFTAPEDVNLHCGVLGANDPIIEKFKVISYPHPLLIDKHGRVFSDSNKELRENGAEGLSEMINRALSQN